MLAITRSFTENASDTVSALVVIASALAAIGVIFAFLKKCRRWRPIAWFERRLITQPRDERRAAVDARIKLVVDTSVGEACIPIVQSIDDLRTENAHQHGEVRAELHQVEQSMSALNDTVRALHGENKDRLDIIEARLPPKEA